MDSLLKPLLLLLLLTSCSSQPKKEDYLLPSIWLYNLHLRRPSFPGAKPDADWGSEDFVSHPKPSSHFDCQPLKELYQEMNLSQIRECLKACSSSKKSAKTWVYQLVSETEPYFKLDEASYEQSNAEEVPNCLKTLLGKIPVPRELFVQSPSQHKEGQKLNCYSARLPIEEKGFLGLSFFAHRFRLRIQLPLQPEPKNDAETVLLLATWSLSPFIDPIEQRVRAHVVTSDLCQECMGEKNLFLETDSLPPLWP